MTADQIVCMAKGRVAGAGKHAELLVSCAEYAALVKMQLTAQQDSRAAAGAGCASPSAVSTESLTSTAGDTSPPPASVSSSPDDDHHRDDATR